MVNELDIIASSALISNLSTGAHSWVRKAFSIPMEGEQTEYVWGVVDWTPDTDFPDTRRRCVIDSHNGTCMLIPREGDKVRLYIQLKNTDATNAVTIKSQMGPHQLLDVRVHLSLFLQESNPWDRWHGNHSNLTLFKRQRLLIGGLFISVRRVNHQILFCLSQELSSVGQRLASKFSVEERVFIVGDACHTHSPKAGGYL